MLEWHDNCLPLVPVSLSLFDLTNNSPGQKQGLKHKPVTSVVKP